MTSHNHDVLMAINSRIINGRSGGAKQLNADYRALVRARNEILKLREELAVLKKMMSPAINPNPKAEPWYPPKPDGYGPWIERKDGDPIPDATEVIGLTNTQRSRKCGAFRAPSGGFWWNSAAKGGRGNEYICAYAIKET